MSHLQGSSSVGRPGRASPTPRSEDVAAPLPVDQAVAGIDAVAALVVQLQQAASEQHVAQLITASATTILGVDTASIVCAGHGGPRLTAISHPHLASLERSQAEVGEGPSVDALAGDTPILGTSEEELRRLWPLWAPTPVERGLRSVLSVRFGTTASPAMALTLYTSDPARLGTQTWAAVRSFAVHTGAALYGRRTADNLNRALETRTVIGQAQGILAERFGLSPDQAFEVLRRYSQDGNVKLRDLADDLVTSGALPSAARTDEHRPVPDPR